jgi:PST family polysaccharide transporter
LAFSSISRVRSEFRGWVSLPTKGPGRGGKKILGNFLALTSVQVANYLLPLVTVPYLVRVIGIEKYGLVAFAQSLIQYFVTLTDYGFNLSAPRDISVARRDDGRNIGLIFVSVVVVKLCLMLLSITILVILLIVVPRFRSEWTLFLFTFGQVIGSVLSPFWFFQGIEKMKYITFLNFVDKLIFTLLLFLIIRKPADYLYVPLLTSAGYIMSGIWGLGIALRAIHINRACINYKVILDQVQRGWHIFVSTISVSAYTNTRLFAVGMFTNSTITGSYALAEKLMYVVQTFPLSSLLQAAYPRLSSMYIRDRRACYRMMVSLQNYTTLLYMSMLVPAFALAPTIIRIISGVPYHNAIVAFRLLLVATFFTNANAFRVQYLLVSGREPVFSRIHVLSGLFGVAIIFLGAYLWSYLGPPIAIIVVSVGVLFATMKSLANETP